MGDLPAGAQAFDEARRRLTQIVVEVSSDDGSVHVAVDSAGGLLDLRLVGTAGLAEAELSDRILNTVRLAKLRIPEAITAALSGTSVSSEIAEAVLEPFRQRFGERDASIAEDEIAGDQAATNPDDDLYFSQDLLRG